MPSIATRVESGVSIGTFRSSSKFSFGLKCMTVSLMSTLGDI